MEKIQLMAKLVAFEKMQLYAMTEISNLNKQIEELDQNEKS